MRRKRKPTYNQLLGIIEKLEAKIVELENKLADTEAKLAAANKDSRRSSKPPSSDIVKPKKKNKHGKKNRIGGQAGHKKPEDKLTTNDADNVVEFHADILIDDPLLDLVPEPELPPKIIYQYEFIENRWSLPHMSHTRTAIATPAISFMRQCRLEWKGREYSARA